MKRRKSRVVCVDDHPFVAEGLRARLQREEDLEMAGWLPSAAHLWQEVKRLEGDVVLLDIEMPGPDPFEMLRDMQRRLPEVRAIILSAYVRDHYFESAVEAGAWGYMSKSDSPDEILEGIRKVLRGEFALGKNVNERWQLIRQGERDRSPAGRRTVLTPREQQILRMIGKGMSRTEIAKSIFRSPKTVDAHRTALMEKLGIHDRVELVRYAIREGLVEP